MTLDIFGFKALWSPYYLMVLILVLALYFFITIIHREKFAGSEPLTKRQALYFSVGIVLLYVIKGSPIDLMGHLMFYAHMIQMAILYLVIPPLFIIGLPQWLWRKVINFPVVKGLFTLFTKPIIALLLFNGVFSFYHIPFVFDLVKTNILYHGAYTAILFLFAVLMWWPLMNELKEEQKLSGLKKLFYLFADGVLITPACALIIFTDVPLYSTFSDPNIWAKALQLCVPQSTISSLNLSGPEMFTSLSLLHDQQLGGVLMKILQELIYGSVLYQVFMKWYRKEQRDSERGLPMDVHAAE